MNLNEKLAELAKPLPKEAYSVSDKPSRFSKPYLKVPQVQARLDKVLGAENWQLDVLQSGIHLEVEKTSAGEAIHDAYVVGYLIVRAEDGTEISRSVVGGRQVKGAPSNALKGALGDALKKAAASLGMPVTLDGGSVQHAQPTQKPPTQKANGASKANGKPNSKRPYSPAVLKRGLGQKADSYGAIKASDKQVGLLSGKLEALLGGIEELDGERAKRLFLRWMLEVESTEDVPGAWVRALLTDWMKLSKNDSGQYVWVPEARAEGELVIREALKQEQTMSEEEGDLEF